MSPTPEQKASVERLYENEAIIDNLTADLAQPVLEWAEQQILAGEDAESVSAAVRAANQSGAQDAATALAAAQQALPATAGKPASHEQVSAPVDVKQKSVAEHPQPSAAPPVTPATAKAAGERELSVSASVPTSASSAPTHDPKEPSSATYAKTSRAFFRRLLGWLKVDCL